MKKVKRTTKHTTQHSYLSPRWSGEILDCSMPMTFDQYDHCSFNCLYCFSWYQKALKALNPLFPNQDRNYREMPVRSVNAKQVERLFRLERETQFTPYVRRRIAFQWGGLCDPFDEFERKHGVGLEVLRTLDELRYPICFSTKGTWWTEDPRYMRMFKRQERWNVKFSVITLDTLKAQAVERGCPSPMSRLDAMARLKGVRGGVTLRLRPFIIGLSDLDCEELIAEAGRRGATAVSTEFFCLESRGMGNRKRYEAMSEAIGFDLFDFYRRNSTGTGYQRLNWKIKAPYVRRMERAARKAGMRFYVSDAHHKDRCANGSCCGLGEGWNYSRGQLTEVLVKARQRWERDGVGRVTWSGDMAGEIKGLYSGFLWRHATGFNTRGTQTRCTRYKQTMEDYIHEMWNSPNEANSPYRYFGGLLRPLGVDKRGDVIYGYKPYEARERGRRQG